MPDVVHAALRARGRRGDLRRRPAAWRRPRGFRLHEQLTGSAGGSTPPDLERAVPGLARARGLHLRSRPTCSTRLTEPCARQDGDPERLHMERFQPKLGRRSRGRAATIRFSQSGLRGRVRRSACRSSSPARRRASSCRSAAGGDLSHVRGRAAHGAGPRPAQRRRCTARRARSSGPASAPPRAHDRDRPVIERPGELTWRPPPNGTRQRTRDQRRAEQPAGAPHPGADRGDRARVRRAPRAGQGRPRRSRRSTTSARDRVSAPARAARARRADRVPLARSPWALGAGDARRWPRSSRTWRSATTSCTASGTG